MATKGRKPLEAFTNQGLILCEGTEDAVVIRHLIDMRSLGISVDVRPIQDIGGVGGEGAFAKAFSAADANTGFPAIKKVLIVADNDHDPAEKFAAVVAQLENAKTDPGLIHKWAKPAHPAKFVNGTPSVAVWMWPSAGVNGCLETILWPTVKSKYPAEAACVEAAMQCSSANTWSLSKQHKAAIRCFFSIAWQKNPGATLSTIFDDPKSAALIPLDGVSLDSIANFLKLNF